MSLINAIGNLRRLCHQHRVRPENIKITIEFLDPEDARNAEYTLRSSDIWKILSYDQLDNICRGADFSFMGFKMQTKVTSAYEKNRAGCDCPFCRR